MGTQPKTKKSTLKKFFCWYFFIALLAAAYLIGTGNQLSMPELVTIGAWVELSGLVAFVLGALVSSLEYRYSGDRTAAILLCISAGFMLGLIIYFFLVGFGLWPH